MVPEKNMLKTKMVIEDQQQRQDQGRKSKECSKTSQTSRRQGIACICVQDICHNYLRPYDGLDGNKTPAEAEQKYSH
jgi:hypothetical protein